MHYTRPVTRYLLWIAVTKAFPGHMDILKWAFEIGDHDECQQSRVCESAAGGGRLEALQQWARANNFRYQNTTKKSVHKHTHLCLSREYLPSL